MERLIKYGYENGLPYAALTKIDDILSSVVSECLSSGPCCLGMTWVLYMSAFDGWEA